MSDKMVQFAALLFHKTKLEKLRSRKCEKKPYPTEERQKKWVSSPQMINCANSVSSHKPFQKGQKSNQIINTTKKILLDTKKSISLKRTEEDFYEQA